MNKRSSREQQDVPVTDWCKALADLDAALKDAQNRVRELEKIVCGLQREKVA